MKKLLILAAVAASAAAYAGMAKMGLHGENIGATDGLMIYLICDDVAIDSAVVKNEKFRFALDGVAPGEYLVCRHDGEGKPEVLLLYLDNYDTHIVLTPETYRVAQSTFIRAESTGNPTHQTMTEVNDIVLNDRPYDPGTNAKMEAKLKEVAARGDMASAFAMWKYGIYFPRFMSYDELKSVLDNLSESVKNSSVGKQAVEKISLALSSMPDAPGATEKTN